MNDPESIHAWAGWQGRVRFFVLRAAPLRALNVRPLSFSRRHCHHFIIIRYYLHYTSLSSFHVFFTRQFYTSLTKDNYGECSPSCSQGTSPSASACAQLSRVLFLYVSFVTRKRRHTLLFLGSHTPYYTSGQSIVDSLSKISRRICSNAVVLSTGPIFHHGSFPQPGLSSYSFFPHCRSPKVRGLTKFQSHPGSSRPFSRFGSPR